MKKIKHEIFLCLLFFTPMALAGEVVKLDCPSPQYSVDPDISVSTSHGDRGYTYSYEVTYKIVSDAMASFIFPAGLEDFEVVSWNGDFRRCWKVQPTAARPGHGLSCEPATKRPGEVWTGTIVLSSKASPGAGKYYVSSMHYHDTGKKYSPRIQTYLKSPEGDEAFQEAALEQCGAKTSAPFASTLMTGATLVPTGIRGISPEALQNAERSTIGPKVAQMTGPGHAASATGMSLRLRTSGGRDFETARDFVEAMTPGNPEALRCQERGVFAEVWENGQIVARQGWQIEASRDCGRPGKFSIVVP